MKEILALADEETQDMWDNLQLCYTEAPGHPVLKEEIAKAFYPTLSSEEIYTFAGAEEGIYACMRALLNPGDHAIAMTPCYQSLISVAEACCDDGTSSAKGVTAVDLVEVDGRWILDLDIVRAAIVPGKTKMIILNYPHNPSGALLTAAEQDAVVELAREHDLWVFFDEVYRGLEIDDSNRLQPMATKYEKALSLGVMSKSLGMAGLRIGWICTQDKVAMQKIADFKHYLSICNSAPAEILSIMALRGKDQLLERNRALIAKNLLIVDAFMLKYGHLFEWCPPIAGCIGFMKFKATDKMSLEELADVLVTKFGCLILPGIHFSFGDKETFKSHFRFGFGRTNFSECIEQFQLALDSIFST